MRKQSVECYAVILLATIATALIFALPASAAGPVNPEAVLQQTNEFRLENGLGPLAENDSLDTAAMIRAKEAAALRSHTRPNGEPYYTAVSSEIVISAQQYIGENLAGGSYTSDTVVSAWIQSEGHRENLLDPLFTQIGVGYYVSDNGTIYWCQLFAA